MFQTTDSSQLCIDSQYFSQQLTFVWSLKHKISQPIYIFNRVRALHLDRLKEGTWLHSFGKNKFSSRCFHVSAAKTNINHKLAVFTSTLTSFWLLQFLELAKRALLQLYLQELRVLHVLNFQTHDLFLSKTYVLFVR